MPTLRESRRLSVALVLPRPSASSPRFNGRAMRQDMSVRCHLRFLVDGAVVGTAESGPPPRRLLD